MSVLPLTIARPIDDPGPGGSDVLNDTFAPAAYDNNPTEWVTDWVETDSAGGGATGGDVQIISELSARGVQVSHFVRTPQWIMPVENGYFSDKERRAFRDPAVLEAAMDFEAYEAGRYRSRQASN